MKHILLLIAVLLTQSCVTRTMWDHYDPQELVWINADDITEEELQSSGVWYAPHHVGEVNGFLVEKKTLEKLRDVTIVTLLTPATLVVDGATVVVIGAAYIGAAVLLTPEFWGELIISLNCN